LPGETVSTATLQIVHECRKRRYCL